MARGPSPSTLPDELRELLPGTGDLMAAVGECWWKCAYSARGGNWQLAAYFARRVRSMLRKLVILRPKYADDVSSFEQLLTPVLGASEGRDLEAFEMAFASSTKFANELHAKWGKSFIVWTLPNEPPKDLELGESSARST